MSRWFTEEQERLSNVSKEASMYFQLVDGKNSVTIDLRNPPLKRDKEFDNDGQKTIRAYHEFSLLGVNEGKVLSVTPFLYGRIVEELNDSASDLVGATEATLEIRKSHPDVNKTNWEVILKAFK